jgi:hypothetical protein
MSQEVGIGNQLYDGAAEVGRFKTFIGLIIGSVIAVGLCLFGFYRLGNSKTYVTLNGKINKVNYCKTDPQTGNNTTPVTTCELLVDYTYNNTPYQSVMKTTDMTHVAGETITIYIEPSAPGTALSDTEWSGWIFIILGIIIVGIAYLHYWLTNRYKFFAAAEGAGLAVNTIKSVF